jgi:Fe-S-cluster containining protein
MVMVTDTDVRRLADGTGRPVTEFARLVGDDDITLDKRSPWWVRLARGRYVMALRWRRGGCVFLGADNRCTVYEHRPVACREHPFNITHSETGALLHLSMSRVVPCPHEWDGDLKRRDLVAQSRWTNRESEAYTELVKQWNRRGDGARTRPAFLRYLGLA